MANEVEIIVSGNDAGAEKAIDQTAKNTKKIGDEADNASEKTRRLGDEFEGMGGKAKASAAEFDEALAQLDDRIFDLGQKSKAVHEEWARTGDFAILDKKGALDKEVEKLSKYRAELGNLKSDLSTFGQGQGGLLNFALDEWIAKLAKGTKQGLSDGLNSISGTAPTGLVQWLVAGGVVAAPAILAAIDGALLAGVGTIGIGAAIAVQAKDPQIQAAYKNLGGEIMSDLTAATANFKGPLIALAGDFSKSWAGVLPGLRQDWLDLAPVVEHFGQGVGGLVTNMMPGFNKAIQASVPVLQMLGNELPKIGDAASSMFDSFARGGEGGRRALQDLLQVLEGTLISVGKLAEYGGKAFEWLDKFHLLGTLAPWMDANSAATDKSKKSLEELNREGNIAVNGLSNLGKTAETSGLGVQLMADDFKSLSGQINATRSDTDQLAASMVDKILGATLSLDRATLGVASAQTSLGDTLAQTGRAIDRHTGLVQTNTKSGEQLRGSILSVVSANQAEYDSMIRAGSSAQDAAASYEINTNALAKQLQQAHFTSAQIDNLIGKYRDVPKNVDTNVQLHGIQSAIDNLTDVIRTINHIPTTHDIYVTTHFSNVGQLYTSPDRVLEHGGNAHGGIIGAASGGQRGGMTWVGESGPELVQLPFGSKVNSAGDSRRMAGGDGASQANPGGARVIEFKGDTDGAFATAFMKLVRIGAITIS